MPKLRGLALRAAYNPDQERDEHGRFGPGGGEHGSPARSALNKLASAFTPVNPNGRDTKEKFAGIHGKYTAERRALHEPEGADARANER